jgi:hypothetical protein
MLASTVLFTVNLSAQTPIEPVFTNTHVVTFTIGDPPQTVTETWKDVFYIIQRNSIYVHQYSDDGGATWEFHSSGHTFGHPWPAVITANDPIDSTREHRFLDITPPISFW